MLYINFKRLEENTKPHSCYLGGGDRVWGDIYILDILGVFPMFYHEYKFFFKAEEYVTLILEGKRENIGREFTYSYI